MKKELKSLLSHKEKNNFSSPDIFSVLNLSLNPARCRLNWCVPSADQQAAALLCNPDSCLVEHIITVCHQPSRKSALAAQPSWEANCPSVAHEQKQRSCLRALNQVRLANPPSLLLAILHCLSKYTRPVVRRQHHLTGCEAAHCMTFFFFLLSHPCLFFSLKMHRSHKILKMSMTTRLGHCSSRSSQCEASNLKVGRFLSPPDSSKKQRGRERSWRSASVYWLTGASCWAPQRPHFIWPIITQKVTVVKVPQVQHRWTDNPHARKCW